MPLQATSGAASYDGFGGGVPIIPNYIEEVFSTTEYVGTGTTQEITNGIDLSTNGGLVWFKPRTTANNNNLIDSARGIDKFLISNATNAQGTASAGYGVTSFNTTGGTNGTGFTLGPPWTSSTNTTNAGYVSWTFRKQPKFFDIVTYTGNKASGRSIAHNLGSTPGCIIIKSATDTEGWTVYHRSLTAVGYYLNLADTSAESNLANGISSVTDSSFTIGSNDRINSTGQTFVAYLFAHNAGGFGLTGTDNVISCGSFTTNGSGNATIDLGYEPQFVMFKSSSSTGDWIMMDTVRGLMNNPSYNNQRFLRANSTQEESVGTGIGILSTGFNTAWFASQTFVYMAIRRGPMKIPTLGTTVFSASTTANGTQTSGVPIKDAVLNFTLTATAGWQIVDRVRGIIDGFTSNTVGNTTTNPYLITNSTTAESASGCRIGGFGIARNIATAGTFYNGDTVVIASGDFATAYFFQRAPSFMDVVCYTGDGAGSRVINHNLGVTPELGIWKTRNGSGAWNVQITATGQWLVLNTDAAIATGTSRLSAWGPTSFTTSTVAYNGNTDTFVTYLFATCPGVSKVFSYTGNGSSQTIDCGFTAGSRWVMIKRTDAAGDWYVWDSANGIVAGNDPHLSLNTAAAISTTDDSIDTDNTGFVVNQVSATNVNVSSATYIGLAIA